MATPQRLDSRRGARHSDAGHHLKAVPDSESRGKRVRKRRSSIVKPQRHHKEIRAAEKPSRSTTTSKAEGRPRAPSTRGKQEGQVDQRASTSLSAGSVSAIGTRKSRVVEPSTANETETTNAPAAEQAEEASQPSVTLSKPPVTVAPDGTVSSIRAGEPAALDLADPSLHSNADKPEERPVDAAGLDAAKEARQLRSVGPYRDQHLLGGRLSLPRIVSCHKKTGRFWPCSLRRDGVRARRVNL